MPVLLAVASAPLLASLAVAAARAPLLLLSLYALLLPAAAGIDLPVGLPAGFESLTSLLGLAALAALALHVAHARRRAAELPLPAVLWTMFLAVSLLTYFWSVNPEASSESLIVLGSLVALYLVAVFVAVDPAELRRLEACIAAGGALTGLVALYQLATSTIAVSGGDIPRFRVGVGGEGGDPNITAASLVLPFAVAFARTSTARGAQARVAYATAAVLTATAIVLTASRGGILAALAALVVLAVVERRGRAAVVYVALPVLAAAATLAVAPQALTARLSDDRSTGRGAIWKLAWSACPRHCPAGSGWGTFPDVHERQVLESPSGKGTQLRFQAHNVLIALTIEAGIAALLIVLAALAATVAELRRLPPVLRGPPLAALTALLVANMFVANLEYKYFWLVLIYAALSVEAARRTPPLTTSNA